jgi:hypothetical protein
VKPHHFTTRFDNPTNAVHEHGTYGGTKAKPLALEPADDFAVLRIEFDMDQCADCDGVFGFMSRAFVTRCFSPP